MRHLRVLLVDLLAFICLLLALTQLLSRSISPAQESEQVSSQVVAMQTPSSVESDQLPLMDFSDLKQRNPEVVGWIRIPETPSISGDADNGQPILSSPWFGWRIRSAGAAISGL